MNVLKETVVRGKRRITIELEDNEAVVAIVPEAHYRMGEPHHDIVMGNHICNAERVEWCVVEQSWKA